jgi:hypothetical protein
MMKPRDLIELVRPDHVLTLTVMPPSLRIQDGEQIRIKCSCGHEANRMENTETWVAYPEIAAALREAWLRFEWTEHLLDQEIHQTDVTRLLKEQR